MIEREKEVRKGGIVDFDSRNGEKKGEINGRTIKVFKVGSSRNETRGSYFALEDGVPSRSKDAKPFEESSAAIPGRKVCKVIDSKFFLDEADNFGGR